MATALMAAGVVGLAQLFGISAKSNSSARSTTFAAVLAQQKMEQLRALTWGFDTLGLPVSDIISNVSVQPQGASGTGLSPSPGGSLNANTPGYVDYLDESGNWVGTGSTIPQGTVFIRRWSVEPSPTNPNNTLILQVFVTRLRSRGKADLGSVSRLPDEARLVSVKTRKST